MRRIMYEILKDFAGPFATVIVAVFVGFITWQHNKRQTDLGQEKLKIDLFERRYAIYVSTRELLSFLCSSPTTEVTWKAIEKWMLNIREAPFFFGPEVAAFLEHVDAMVDNLFGKMEWQQQNADAPGDIAEKIHRLQILMSTELLKLPQTFRKDLEFGRF